MANYNHICFKCLKKWKSKKKFIRWCPYCGHSMKNKLFNGSHLKERVIENIVRNQNGD